MMQHNYRGTLYSFLTAGYIYPAVVGILILFLILSFSVFAIPFIIILTGVLFFTEGIEIDFDKNKFRNFKLILLRFGKWKNLPPINKVKVAGVTEQRKFYGRSTSSIRVSEKMYQVIIYYTFKGRTKDITVLRTKDSEKAKGDADYLHQKLMLKTN